MSDAHADAPQHVEPDQVSSTGLAAMHAMRGARKRRRLGNIEWFDAAYRVYLVALFGGGALLWLSDLVGDDPLTAAQASDVLRHGPPVLGMVAVLAFAAGLRSGSQGGPLALEGADVTHVMLSPVPRRAALIRPAVQRVAQCGVRRRRASARSSVSWPAGDCRARPSPGSVAARCSERTLHCCGSAPRWSPTRCASRLRSALRSPPPASAWQGLASATDVPGPADIDGSLGMWGWRQHPVDLDGAGPRDRVVTQWA